MLDVSDRSRPASQRDPIAVLSKATFRAAERLQVRQSELAGLLGASTSSISRAAQAGRLPESGKTIELATLFVRVFRSLDAVMGGDEASSAAWLRADNLALGAPPLDRMLRVEGLVDVLQYLDARRAVV